MSRNTPRICLYLRLTSIVALVGLIGLMLSAVGCASKDQRQQLAATANRALVVAEAFGAVKPVEAAAIRKGGKLLIDLDTAGTQEAKIAVLSDAVVDFAQERGAISDAEADQLRAAKVVDLPLDSAAITPSK